MQLCFGVLFAGGAAGMHFICVIHGQEGNPGCCLGCCWKLVTAQVPTKKKESIWTRSPSSALCPPLVWGQGSPTEIDDRKKIETVPLLQPLYWRTWRLQGHVSANETSR